MTTDSTSTIHVAFCALTDVGRVREHNEDAFVAMDLDGRTTFNDPGVPIARTLGPKGLLLAVSDGMGGAQAGEVASALVLETLEETLSHADDATDGTLRDAVEQANRAVFDAARDPTKRGMGATLTAVLVHGNFAYIASVGDSRAYLLRGSRFRQMTKDHSYVQVMIDAGVIDSAEAERSPMKHVVLQSMGQNADVQVAMGRLRIFRGDRLVLCSDGLTGHLKDAEISAEISRRDLGLDVIARQLVAKALERGGEDNITVVVAELSGNGLARADMSESVTQTFEVISEFTPGFADRSRSAKRHSVPSSVPPPPPEEVAAEPPRTSGRIVTIGLVVIVVVVATMLAVFRAAM